MQPIQEIIAAALWTGRLDGESPVSLCMVARQQSAKSAAMIGYSETSTVKVFSDVTSKPLLALKEEISAGRLRHLMLLDLHTIVSHNRYTTDRTLQIMAGLMEEGLGSVADAGGTIEIKGLPKIGIIMAITPEFYDSKRGFWRQNGFLSRFLVVNWKYSDDTHARIHRYIRDGGKKPAPRSLKLPEKPAKVEIRPQEMQAIQDLSQQWGALEDDPAFRYHRQLRRLCMASAAMDGRSKTSEKDLARIASWGVFFRPSQPVEI